MATEPGECAPEAAKRSEMTCRFGGWCAASPLPRRSNWLVFAFVRYGLWAAMSGAGSQWRRRITVRVHLGIHQLASPSSRISAGTTRARMTVASKAMPAARPIASGLSSRTRPDRAHARPGRRVQSAAAAHPSSSRSLRRPRDIFVKNPAHGYGALVSPLGDSNPGPLPYHCAPWRAKARVYWGLGPLTCPERRSYFLTSAHFRDMVCLARA